MTNITRIAIALTSVAVVAYCVLLQACPNPRYEATRVVARAAEHVRTHAADHARRNDNDRPLAGTTVVITGATSGIGRSLATTVHGLGATLVAMGRSPRRLAALEKELSAARGDDDDDNRVITVVADLSDLDSVSKAADDILHRFRNGGIDFLINNAGLHYQGDLYNPFVGDRLTSTQGYDLAFAVNYLSHFLLTAKLLPLMEQSKGFLNESRVVQISSSYHWHSDGTDLVAKDDGSPPVASVPHPTSVSHKAKAYGTSKLAQIYHMRALHRRLRTSKVKVVSVCPAWVITNIGGKYMEKLEGMGGFPVDGVGINSALNAMFLPGIDEHHDFVAQVNVSLDVFPAPGSQLAGWVRALGVRELITDVLAGVLFVTQRFLYEDRVVRRSSAESYDASIQESLYTWSEEQIRPWLGR